jgi:hypothetical protein
MENEHLPIGQLFENIPYSSEEEISMLIENMNTAQATLMLTQALEMSIRQNIFSLHELEIVLKSIRILNKLVFVKKENESK